MTWHARLDLDYRADSLAATGSVDGPPPNGPTRTTLQFVHDGPLRVLQSLYPEGPAICHNVLVHPPGGLVAGDTLDVRVWVRPGAHGWVGTPGATRFYRSESEWATQRVQLVLEENARLEWFPLETLAYPGCRARNHLSFSLSPGAELMGWDITALGLPGGGQAFDAGLLDQRLTWPGHWREEALISATDQRLLNSPLGLDGHRCMGTFWLATGSRWAPSHQSALIDAARQTLPTGLVAAATCPHPQLLVVRALAPVVEPVLLAFQNTWAALRPVAWGLAPQRPRIWGV